mgnify:FL=1
MNQAYVFKNSEYIGYQVSLKLGKKFWSFEIQVHNLKRPH